MEKIVYIQYPTIDVQRTNKINKQCLNGLINEIKSVLMKQTMQEITNKLMSNNKGVTNSKKEFKKFRDYWAVARNSWDQKKIRIMIKTLFVPIMRLIKQVSIIYIYVFIFTKHFIL